MLISDLIYNIETVISDHDMTSYTDDEMRFAINDAQRLVCYHRPDAKSSTSNLLLVAGAKQTIPSTARRLISCVRNMGADGSTPGNIIRLVNQQDLDRFSPSWTTETDVEVSHYVYDETRPTEFYIYPIVTPPFYIEIKTADKPIDITATTSSLNIDDIYSPVIVSWAAYRLLSRDRSDSSHNIANAHKMTALDILGVKMQSDSAITPNVRQG